jgi:hypothetical protein
MIWGPHPKYHHCSIDGKKGVDAVLDVPSGMGQVRFVKDVLIAFEAKMTTTPLGGPDSRSHMLGDHLWQLGCVLRAGHLAAERDGDAAERGVRLTDRVDGAILCTVEVDGQDPTREPRWHALMVSACELRDAVGEMLDEMPGLEEEDAWDRCAHSGGLPVHPSTKVPSTVWPSWLGGAGGGAARPRGGMGAVGSAQAPAAHQHQLLRMLCADCIVSCHSEN